MRLTLNLNDMRTLSTVSILLIVMLFFTESCKKDNNIIKTPPTDTVKNKEQIRYEFDFTTDDKTWSVGNDNYSTGTIANGYYSVFNKSDSSYYTSTTGVLFYSLTDSLALEAKLNIRGGNTTYPAFGGLVWNYRIGGKQVNVFGIYNDGRYEIFGFDSAGKFIEFKPPIANPAVKANADNILRISQQLGTFHFFINGTEVFNMPVGGYTLDLTGIYSDPKTTTSVDYYKAIKLNY